ncbi:MlaD family protein [Variovorax saccharolyticus]|uniref:MlaD family protein n=1 Tax=Variovorax saccharolyticus TaxID=3053516 RepID=UPI002576D3D2|nr:MlaD family protein [Variovorax sp. J22R187]MDM0018716.1 MlaD family protein [Variovorax sp. J22R187]
MPRSEPRRWTAFAIPLLVLVIATLLAWLSWQQGLFTRHDRLYLDVPDAAGMAEGMPVTTHGVVIGRVRSIALAATPAGERGARVELGIGREFMAQIPKGSRARLVQQDAIGRPAIDLLPPRGSAQPVTEGDLLAFERARDGSQIVQEVQAALLPAIADARKLTDSLSDPEGSFQQTLKAGQEVVSKMPAIAEKTGEVLQQTQQAVKAIESGATATLQKAGRTIEVVAEAAPSVIDKVQQAAATSQQASAELQAMAAQASERLPGVLEQVQAAATQTNQMVSNARQTWPISLLTGTPTTPQSLPIDSIGGLPLPGETP